MALRAYFLHLISDCVQTSDRKRKLTTRRQHSSAVCHDFVEGPAGCWCLARMKLLIRGRRRKRKKQKKQTPKQTRQPGADIPVAVGNRTVAETWGDTAAGRASPRCGGACQFRVRAPACVWPLAWATVRSFRMISFTGEKEEKDEWSKTSRQQWHGEIHQTFIFDRHWFRRSCIKLYLAKKTKHFNLVW